MESISGILTELRSVQLKCEKELEEKKHKKIEEHEQHMAALADIEDQFTGAAAAAKRPRANTPAGSTEVRFAPAGTGQTALPESVLASLG
eukprot:1927709-Lingulodinium_polyedra.AAC.1